MRPRLTALCMAYIRVGRFGLDWHSASRALGIRLVARARYRVGEWGANHGLPRDPTKCDDWTWAGPLISAMGG